MKLRTSIAAALVLALARPAFADAPKPLAESLTGTAKEAYDSARTLYGASDWATALVKFKLAYDASHDPRLLWNMAACEKNQRHYAKALPLVRQYLAEGADVLSPQDKADAEELVKVMEPLTAMLTVTVDQPGAEVAIDGGPVGTSPVQPVRVDVGTRKITVKKQGFQELTQEARIDGGAAAAVEVKLVKILHQARLGVKTTPADATVQIDGKVVGKGAWSEIVPSGGHVLRVTSPGMVPYQSEVVVQDDQPREVSVSLDAEPNRGVPLWVWVAGGVVAAGGLALGGYFLFKQDSTYVGPVGSLGVVQASWPHR